MADRIAGGDITEGEVDAARDSMAAIGKGNDQRYAAGGSNYVRIGADTATWREFVKRDIERIHEELDDLRGRIMFLLICVLFLFIAGAITTALVIRGFDMNTDRINTNSSRLERLEREQQFVPGARMP